MIKIEIHAEQCDHCNLCLAACRHGGLSMIEGKIATVTSAECGDCYTCEFICARGAIRWNYEIVMAEALTSS